MNAPVLFPWRPPLRLILRDHRASAALMGERKLRVVMRTANRCALDSMERRWPGSRNHTATMVSETFGVSKATAWRWLNEETPVQGAVLAALLLADVEDGLVWRKTGR